MGMLSQVYYIGMLSQVLHRHAVTSITYMGMLSQVYYIGMLSQVLHIWACCHKYYIGMLSQVLHMWASCHKNVIVCEIDSTCTTICISVATVN